MSSRLPVWGMGGAIGKTGKASGAISGLARVLAVAVPVLLTVGSPAFAEPSTADIQWAQSILKEKGFDIGGRANGQMTPQTRSALSAYQKSVGLPASGNLDQATISRMLGDREKKATPTMGSLSKSQIGQSAREKEVVPHAAPTQRVESGNESFGAMPQFGPAPSSTGHSSTQTLAPSVQPAAPAARSSSSALPQPSVPSSATAEAPAPLAAPRAAVTATDTAGKPVEIVQKGQESSGLPGWFANLLRYGVMGMLAATVGGIGFAWWRSGRSAGSLPIPEDRPEQDNRREPSFSAKRREELTVPAGFSGDVRARR